jgi:hypothetical protein
LRRELHRLANPRSCAARAHRRKVERLGRRDPARSSPASSPSAQLPLASLGRHGPSSHRRFDPP